MITREGAQPPIRRQRIITRETVLWSTAAVLAAGYLLVLGLAPEVIEDLTPTMLDPQSSQGQRAAARLASDVKALRDSVAQVQLDLSKVKTEVAGYGESQKVLAQQVATISKTDGLKADGTKADGATASQVTAQADQPPAAASAAQKPSAAAAGLEAAAPVTTTVMPKVINAESKEPVLSMETGSVDTSKTANASAIDFGPAVVKKAPKPVGVQISSGASIDSLRLSWSLLAEQHADTLKNLEARVVDKGDAANPNFNLVAGPIKSKAEAIRVCKALAARNVPCKVGEFTGETL